MKNNKKVLNEDQIKKDLQKEIATWILLLFGPFHVCIIHYRIPKDGFKSLEPQ